MLNTIIVNIKDWPMVSGTLIGQTGSKMVVETDTLPMCSYQDASLFGQKVEQRCLPAKLGRLFTIVEIQEARVLLEELGEFAEDAQTLNELRLMKQVTDAELALVAVYEEVANA